MSNEIEKMSLAELLVYLLINKYQISFRGYGGNNVGSGIVITMQKDFHGEIMQNKKFISDLEFVSINLSYETILKTHIIKMHKEFDKYNDIKKKVTK